MAKNSPAANNSGRKIMKKRRKGIDIISQLPDELLIRILSLLPAADVTRSRILSNRWKHLWAFLPNLHFVIPQIKKQTIINYIDSANQTLALRGGMPIQKLYLQCSCAGNYLVNNWFRVVSQHKVEVVADDTYDVRFHWDLSITFNTLIKLTLKGVVLVTPIVEIPFPCLKILHFQCTRHHDTQSLMNLISHCPVLEELCLDGSRLSYRSCIFKLCSRSMRRLTFKSIFMDEGLVIDAPKLEYLHVFACCFLKYTLMNPTSVVEAYISNNQIHNMIQLLRCVSSTKILTLTCDSVFALRETFFINLPMFPNLVKLEIPLESKLLLVLLNKMPNLEYLTFSDEHHVFGLNWNPLMEEAPACLRFKLKEIFIVFYVIPLHIAIISYLLKHANNLEKLTIAKVNPRWRKQWLNIHRASKSSCRIEFV